LNFLSLRADAHAQYEIRAYAEAMFETVRAWVPATFAAFQDYRLGAATLSGPMLAIVRRMLEGEAVEQPGSGLSKREWAELMEILGRGREQEPGRGHGQEPGRGHGQEPGP